MMNLILCVCFSVAVSVFLKVASAKKINLMQAIAMNYFVAIACVIFLLKPEFNPENRHQISYSVLFGLGVLLPSVFLMLGKAVQTAGIVRSDAAQRLSLFIPIVASFTLLGEHLSLTRFIGLILAFAALFCLLDKPKASGAHNDSQYGWVYLLLVWVGFGVIDVCFKMLAKTGQSSTMNLLMVFALAGILSCVYVAIKRQALSHASLLAGVLLGCMNFANIHFYIQAHQEFSTSPTLVFAGVNIGVIVTGLLVGAILFKEKLSRWNILGIVLAVSAIAVLFYFESWMRSFGIRLEI